MICVCENCPMEFKSGAALNFHMRKVHKIGVQVNGQADRNESAPRKRKGPAMTKFNRIPGMKDYTKGPFKVSHIPLKTTQGKEALEATPTKKKKLAEPVENGEEYEDHEQSIPIIKRKRTVSDPEVVEIADEEEDDVDVESVPSPILPDEPQMPLLTPQASPIPSPIPKSRPGPKCKKYNLNQGRNHDSSSNHQEAPKKKTPTPEPAKLVVKSSPKKISRFSKPEDSHSSLSSGDDGSRAQSRQSGNGSNLGAQLLAAALQEKLEQEQLNRSQSKRQSSSSSSLSDEDEDDDDNVKTEEKPNVPPPPVEVQDPPPTASEVPPVVSRPGPGRGRPKGCPYICPIESCQKSNFQSYRHYINHLEMHEGKRPYPCPVCSFGYETVEKLLEHMSCYHSQGGKFTCPKCGVDYKKQRYFELHEKKCTGK